MSMSSVSWILLFEPAAPVPRSVQDGEDAIRAILSGVAGAQDPVVHSITLERRRYFLRVTLPDGSVAGLRESLQSHGFRIVDGGLRVDALRQEKGRIV